MPSAEMSMITMLFESAPPGDPTDVATIRAGYEMFGSSMAPPVDVERTDTTVAGVPGEWIRPTTTSTERTVLYLHGGGYVMGSRASHQAVTGELARVTPANVLMIEYRLAPEHPPSAAIDDALGVARALLDDVDPAAFAIAGDSAGGGLALRTALALAAAGDPVPAAIGLTSPWTDLTLSGDSMTSIGDADPLLKPAMLEAWTRLYLADQAEAADPSVSPLFADLAVLPPLLVQVGERECLLDDSTRLVERARAQQVDATLVVAPEMIHHWTVFGPGVPESAEAIAELGAWLAAKTRG